MLKVRRRRQARELALAALKKNPKEPLAAVVMAELELRSEDLPAAVEHLARALDREDPHRHVLELLARIRIQQEDYLAAADLYDLGRKKFPNNAGWLKGLARAYSKVGDENKLKTTLKELSRLDADNIGVRKKLAEMELAAENYAAALAHSKSALHIDVLDPDIHRMLAGAYLGLKQYTKVIEECQVSLELKPNDVAVIYHLATAYAETGDKAAARTQLRTLLKENPSHVKAKKLLQQLE